MNIDSIIGLHSAAVVGPTDVVILTVERYLTGQQLDVLGKHFQKKLPNNQVLILQKGMTAEVRKAAPEPLDIPKL